MAEEWKNCFEDYEISNIGNCRKKMKNGGYRIIKGSIQNRGYRYFQVQRNGKRINKLFHHLVAKEFISERPDKKVIDHIDRNKLNNKVDNLRYISQLENVRNSDMYRDDIEEKDPVLRKRIISRMAEIKNVEEKKYTCDICPCITPLKCVFHSKYEMEKHNNSKRHKHRVWLKGEMEKHNLPFNSLQYKRLKNQIGGYKKGERKKPLIIW